MRGFRKILSRVLVALLYVAKILNVWIFVIPMKLKIIGSFLYFGLMYLIFGTCYMSDIRYDIFEENQIAQLLIFFFFGLPGFMGFVYFMAPTAPGSNINENLDRVIAHRNNMMAHSSSKEAYEIMKNTAHLDVMRSGPEYNNAVKGFNAKHGKDGPSSTLKDLMGKK